MLLTIFTPAYNRKHTISRTYESLLRQTCKDFQWLIIDDGSSDGTREWAESLGHGSWITGQEYDWMGRRTGNKSSDRHYAVDIPNGDSTLHIEYIYKPNGGLFTGYNVAYDIIDTELCVCIDSDDYAADDLVEKICRRWEKKDKSKEYCGIMGLDFNVVSREPIGGAFSDGILEGSYWEVKKGGDTKDVMRADLMRTVAPMIGFEGEKDFNPFYMYSQILDKYPILIENSIFCWVEYQVGGDSLSQAIFKQFKRSPRSYAKYRLNEMRLRRYSNLKDRIRLCCHYISACIFAGDKDWLTNCPFKLTAVLCAPMGLLLNIYIRYKAR